jgi:hypothetical protein
MTNLQAAAHTRAAQLARGAIKSRWLADGKRERDFRTSDHRSAITELAMRPEFLERATADIERWFGKKGRRIRARGTPDF